jgi:hypothetical protein
MPKSRTSNSPRIAVAGAGLLAVATACLIGCDQSTGAAIAETEERTGQSWLYGEHPKNPRPTATDRPQVDFRPKYYAVVYLQFDNGARLTARHAYFPVVQGKPDNVVCGLGYLRSFDTSPDPKPDCEPFTDAANRPKAVAENFDDFTFGSQQRLYVFVDNTNVKFNGIMPVSFTPFGAFDEPDVPGTEPKDPNLSFYNAKLGDFGPYRGVLTLDNYYRGEGDEDILDTPPYTYSAEYSINFNLVTCRNSVAQCDASDPKQVIPLVIDPDTGNGKGSHP